MSGEQGGQGPVTDYSKGDSGQLGNSGTASTGAAIMIQNRMCFPIFFSMTLSFVEQLEL